jgi:diguanylate cyclase (GGDEF)-like protein
MTADWVKRLETLCVEYEHTVKTQLSADQDLRGLVSSPDSPISAVNINISPAPPFDVVNIGDRGAGDPSGVNTFPMDGVNCRVSWWLHSAVANDKGSLLELFSRLAQAFWKPQLRDHKSRLLSLQIAETYVLIDRTLKNFADRAFVLFTDLDHFKRENDKYGEDGGDEIILQFSARVDRAIRPNAIPIHRSGDEFCAVLLSSSADDALDMAARLMHEMQGSKFSVKGAELSLGISVGIARSSGARDLYADIEKIAVEACKPSDGEKKRGRITFSNTSGRSTVEKVSDFQLAAAFCLVRSAAADEAPFANVVLNLVSRTITESLGPGMGLEAMQNATERVLNSTTAALVPGLIQAAIPRDGGADVSLQVGFVDVGLAVSHGLFRASLRKNIAVTGRVDLLFNSLLESCDLQIDGNSHVHLGDASPANPQSRILGSFMTSSAAVSVGACGRALLVRIGHTPTPLPSALFAETIVVDDRPTRGGGLPDFWEATIARIVGQLDRNPNIDVVYVLGDKSAAALTVQRLQNVQQWTHDSEQMAFKTGMPADKIRSAAQRLIGNVVFCNTPQEIVTDLEPKLRQTAVIQPLTMKRPSTEAGFLNRQLEVSPIALNISDGCRLDTIAQAYPVVVEIVRKSDQCWLTKDQAGIELRELTDFKVRLARPLDDQVPAFYESESQSLKEYFEREFLSDDGTFGKVLKETAQLEPVVHHIANVIRGMRATTRRGILIIPNVPASGDDVAPLGLVCVRVVPRISATKLRFDFSFVWRTVEVLVGFPYSLYGSVKFSEHLTSLLRKNLPTDGNPIEMGEVSYTAQSLHMFTDEYGQIIARRIVNNASL